MDNLELIAALSAMLREYELAFGSAIDSDDSRENGAFSEYWKARALIDRLTRD